MSISPIGNSDAYERYRQQALDLLASPSQPANPKPQTAALSYVAPPAATDQSSSNPFATKFKADLSGLGSPQNGKSHAHGAHGGHHKADSTNLTDPTTDPTDPTATTDVFGQALDEFGDLLKSPT